MIVQNQVERAFLANSWNDEFLFGEYGRVLLVNLVSLLN